MGYEWHDSDFGFEPTETIYIPDEDNNGYSIETWDRFFSGDYDIIIKSSTIDHPRCVVFTAKQSNTNAPVGDIYRIIFKRRDILRSKYILQKKTDDEDWIYLSEVYYNCDCFEDNIESLMSELIRRSMIKTGWRLFKPHKCIF